MKVGSQIHEPLSVHGHQVDNLPHCALSSSTVAKPQRLKNNKNYHLISYRAIKHNTCSLYASVQRVLLLNNPPLLLSYMLLYQVYVDTISSPLLWTRMKAEIVNDSLIDQKAQSLI